MTIEELGRRAVACKHWRWMPGMKSRMDGAPARRVQDDVRTFEEALNVNIYPDLADPATLGCLLALVREAWPESWHQCMVPVFDGMGHWYMGCMMHGRIIMPTRLMPNGLPDTIPPKPTEAEALVAALEAAP